MNQYDIAAYVWPAYTGADKRANIFWPEGIGEWQSVRSARAKFDGHSWPRKPLWGYVNESDPNVMEMEINVALNHGVNTFIYDWYWYDNRPFLENCLNDGFLQAKNNRKMHFYLMWANHDAMALWDKRLSDDTQKESTIIWSGEVNNVIFDSIVERLITKYFVLPNYYTIDECPVFMIYDIGNLIRGLGGIDQTKKSLKRFRDAVISFGFKGLHIQMALWNESGAVKTGVDGKMISTNSDIVDSLEINSITHYQFIHFADTKASYSQIIKSAVNEWRLIDSTYNVPYYPHVSIGWDNNPRFDHKIQPVIADSSPEIFRQGLVYAKQYLDAHYDQNRLITVNSWNEWTESSYLQPDDIFGYEYLKAIKETFKK